MVNHEKLNLRQEPKLDGKVEKTLSRRTKLQVKKRQDDWLYVVDPDGASGWVARYLTMDTEIAQKLNRYHSVPYGNESPEVETRQ